MRSKKIILPVLLASILSLGGCKKKNNTDNGVIDKYFVYEEASFVDKYGSATNDEAHSYNSLKVNRVENTLRDDFAFGVDASMTKAVEKAGGKYFNKEGKEQDIFQILKRSGVNFVRFRLWNNPQNKYKQTYGGGGNNASVDIELAKRAKAANLNVLIDFHYSDFWADPDRQRSPRDWADKDANELPAAIEDFTRTTLNQFKSQGVTVDAVQIGNETNNGLAGYAINWNSFDSSMRQMSDMFKGGIKGAKDVFPNVRTIIHLANGGNTAEFEAYYTALGNNGVNYDIIGASFYPHLSGSLEDLQTNLNNVSNKTGKPVMVVETSWGHTEQYIEGVTENTYSSADEDVGGYLTSEQAQATELRDICNVLSKVPNQKGLGIFYWEPGWLPIGTEVEVEGETVTQSATPWATAAGQSYQYVGNDSKRTSYSNGGSTWSNQGLFSYTGKALSSLSTFAYIREGKNEATETVTSARSVALEVTINTAANETLPSTGKVVTDFDAIRSAPIVWDEAALEQVKTKGTYSGLHGVLDGKYDVLCYAKCIENYVVDPGFENQGETDTVKAPWHIDSVSPSNDKVVKLDRKKDIRSGKTDLNWYHSSSEFSFRVSQTITGMPAGSYSLTSYVMGVAPSQFKHNKLVMFAEINGDKANRLEFDAVENGSLQGWSAGYQTMSIPVINLPEGATLVVGLEGGAVAGAWAHNDDWELVSNS